MKSCFKLEPSCILYDIYQNNYRYYLRTLTLLLIHRISDSSRYIIMSKKESWDEFLRKNASSITENHLSSDEFAAKERADTSSYSHRSFQETVPPRRVESLLTEAMTSAVRNETCLDCECMRVSSGLLTRPTRTDSHSNIVSASWNKKKITKETRHKSSCKRKKTDKKSSMATNTDLRSIVKKRGSRKASRSSGSGSSRESSRRQKYCNFEVELKKETVNDTVCAIEVGLVSTKPNRMIDGRPCNALRCHWKRFTHNYFKFRAKLSSRCYGLIGV